MRPAAFAVSLAVSVIPSGPAYAWTIDTFGADPCHERLTLGALDDAPEVVAAMVARVRATSVPVNEAAQSFVKQIVEEFSLQDRTPAEQFVLASFVAGAREPDTRGFSLARLPEARETHLVDGEQASHTLRTSVEDGPAGDLAAIADARGGIHQLVAAAGVQWAQSDPRVEARWDLSYYGTVTVQMFGPAYLLGEAMHGVEDAYAHVLRDADGRIVAVLNYVDPIQHASLYVESRDSLAHSDRLDECVTTASGAGGANGDDAGLARDAERFDRARAATAAFIRAALTAVTDAQAPAPPEPGVIDAVLDEVFAYHAGCNLENKYCDSADYPIALEGLSKPYSACVCSLRGDASASPWLVALLGLGLVTRGRRWAGRRP